MATSSLGKSGLQNSLLIYEAETVAGFFEYICPKTMISLFLYKGGKQASGRSIAFLRHLPTEIVDFLLG